MVVPLVSLSRFLAKGIWTKMKNNERTGIWKKNLSYKIQGHDIDIHLLLF
jgi:hypothetical protein